MTLPTVNELLCALEGDVPKTHEALAVLRAAWTVAAMDKWLNILDVRTDDGEPVFELLDSLGFGGAAQETGAFAVWLRAQIAARIDAAVPQAPGAGDAVARLAEAWLLWRTTREYGYPDEAQQGAEEAFRTARRAYKLLASGGEVPA